MQLTIRATGDHVQVLSYLLAKNPNNLYERKHKGHFIRLFYSQFSEKEVEATIFVTPDPLELVKKQANTYDITHYINDREFAVSSIFCSLIRSSLGTALNGMPNNEYEKWVHYDFPFEFSFGPVSSSLTDQQIKELFDPIGYETTITREEIDYSIPIKERSTARYISIKGKTTLQNGLRQLFILIPVLDNYKHYYIDEKEVEKLERYGQGWLEAHPLREYILRRSLRFKEIYSLVNNQETNPNDTITPKQSKEKVRLNDLRYEKIINKVQESAPKETIIDFGSGEGKLSARLGFVDGVKEILAVEPSEAATLKAKIRFEKVAKDNQFLVPTTLWGSLFYYDERFKNKDILILCEVIEHIDEARLPKIMDLIFHEYQPKMIIITTPNKEYNKVYELNDHMRHDDHRFEWTREYFQNWCTERAEIYPYSLSFEGIGEENEQYGFPTQMCVFSRKEV
ncbi:3' terminal RNA ribose 2'-O-methyltransferase Hen1 [Heyndrickxia sporothermodurans]